MPFRFIHTGDLHLDSPLRGLRAIGDPRAERAADAARRAFVRLVDFAIEEQLDAFLIAGDLWDGDWTDIDAGLMVGREAARLRAAGIGVVAILGNHDAAAASVTAHIRRLDALTVLADDKPQSVVVGPAVVHGQSFATQAVTQNLAAHYPLPVPGQINVALLHTALDGSRGHSPYAPTTAEELAAKGYDYFALAHVHTREVLFEGPAARGGTAAYCGVLQGRHIGESGPKGAFVVSIDGPGAPAELTAIDLPFVAWHKVEADVSTRTPSEAMAVALSTAAAALPQDLELAAVRVVLTGTTPRHAALASDRRRLADEAAFAAANADGRFLLEEVRVATTPVAGDAALPRLPQHFEADLRSAAAEGDIAKDAAAQVRDILAVLPAEARRTLLAARPDLEAFARTGEVDGLLDAAARGLSARIGGA